MTGAEKGTLYLCATPIGNIEDITLRAVKIMAEADIIAAEDTRRTRKLLARYDIHTRLVSYHEHNKFSEGPKLAELLAAGKTIVCVSDAGIPGIADPGCHLAALAIDAGANVSPLPGANAALSALVCSGLDASSFVFVGFLPKTAKKRREVLERIKNYPETMIFYEAPHRLKSTLEELAAHFGDRKAALCRELTKKFESFFRGTLASCSMHCAETEPRGEYVVVVAGRSDDAAVAMQKTEVAPTDFFAALIKNGMSKKEAMRKTAKEFSLSRRDVYKMVSVGENGQTEEIL